MGVKQFDHPYLLTLGADNGGWIRYQILPAYVHGHRVNPVYYTTPVKYWSGHFHCMDCKIMGNNDTLKRYNCG